MAHVALCLLPRGSSLPRISTCWPQPFALLPVTLYPACVLHVNKRHVPIIPNCLRATLRMAPLASSRPRLTSKTTLEANRKTTMERRGEPTLPKNLELTDREIAKGRNDIRTDKLDMSYGEITNLYEAHELVISPEYQRLFRWTPTQKARFIESILLGFPTPAIFVAEDEHGIWELVDGLQRISTVLEFMGVLRDDHDATLSASTLISAGRKPRLPSLDGVTYKDLSLQARLSIKRAGCRVEVIKVGSKPTMKYDVFERLNTGGSELTPQEVRNCIFRATNPKFVDWVDKLAQFGPFRDNLLLSDLQENTLFDRGLVLRYLTMKNIYQEFEHDVEPFITDYMRAILEKERDFRIRDEERLFKRTFRVISDAMGDESWRHMRNGRHTGPFSVYIYDTLSVGVAVNIDRVEGISANKLRSPIEKFKQDKAFLDNTGEGANNRSRLLGRMDFACDFFSR